MAEFNIRELVSRAFVDYVGPLHPTWFIKNSIENPIVFPSLDTISAIVDKNRPFFMQLQLSHKGVVFELPNEPLVSLSLKKTIVETATVGEQRRGTVKEYINTEDWNITIRGICYEPGEKQQYPAKQVAVLNALFDINDALKVENNKFFELFGVRNIVLKDLKFEEMTGQPSLQKYTITAVSDEDFLATIIK